ncbi:MAG: response regulator [Chloroflexi bacterium]|nr:MAG: response regulator [Chloroflexota bacterium]
MTKVLLIEDDPALAQLMMLRLDRLDMDVFHASNGQLAIDYLEVNQPDLILLDLNIPYIDGWEVLDYAKTQYGAGNFGVIVTTARKDMINRAKGDIESVDVYLVKPFTSEQLFHAINTVMQKLQKTSD